MEREEFEIKWKELEERQLKNGNKMSPGDARALVNFKRVFGYGYGLGKAQEG